MKEPPQEPQTPEEWQLVFDLASGWRYLEDCKSFGILTGGPSVSIARCDEIIERGRHRGLTLSRPVAEIARDLIGSVDAVVQQNEVLRRKLLSLGCPRSVVDNVLKTADPAKVDALLEQYGALKDDRSQR